MNTMSIEEVTDVQIISKSTSHGCIVGNWSVLECHLFRVYFTQMYFLFLVSLPNGPIIRSLILI